MDREDSTAPEACSGVPTAAEQGSLREEPLPTDLAAAAAAAEEQVCLLSTASAHVLPSPVLASSLGSMLT